MQHYCFEHKSANSFPENNSEVFHIVFFFSELEFAMSVAGCWEVSLVFTKLFKLTSELGIPLANVIESVALIGISILWLGMHFIA